MLPGKSIYSRKKLGEYTIEKSVGEGRYGTCFLAYSAEGNPVIIKRFKPKMFRQNRERNAYEAVILSQLKHEQIPELLGIINRKGFYCFILEYKPGASIENMLFKQRKIFTGDEIYNIGLQLIGIIKYLHTHGVVHRDIRCANVLYDGSRISLVDFGLARWADGERYKYDFDFSYLGDFLLYLIYSSIQRQEKHTKSPWYEELTINSDQKIFLKKLLRIELPYGSIYEVEEDFNKFFYLPVS